MGVVIEDCSTNIVFCCSFRFYRNFFAEPYPIIICNNKNYKHPPNKHLNSLEASPIYIDCIENTSNYHSMYIHVYPHIKEHLNETASTTYFLEFLENKLSEIANDEFILKSVAEKLNEKIDDIILKSGKDIIALDYEEINKIAKSLYGIYFHKNMRVTYFDDLYTIAKKQISFPNSDPEHVRIYSYLLASLMSFKEYVDELPARNYLNYYAEGNETSIDIDITPYKQEFYNLFDQTVEIFKKRCAADNNADINISYDDKLIQLFDCFITELINEDSNIIIKPAKTKQGLIFLDFHSYFEHFELFLEKQNFNYSISKQKFNRLLYDNKILKPRYNGSDKTPPKLDYILQANEQKYTVLAIKLDILKAKISELSK